MNNEPVHITVPFDIGRLSPNKRLHPAERRRLQRTAKSQAWFQWNAAGRPTFDCPVDVSVTIYRGRVMDQDNATASMKHICDGLFCGNKNYGGVTPDDSTHWVRFVEIRQETGKRWVGSEEVCFDIRPRKED